MKLYFATDHAGFNLKNELVSYLQGREGVEVIDCGAYAYDEGDDFTAFIPHAAKAVVADFNAGITDSRAIILGGSGEGEAMAANRFQGIRATVYYGGDTKILELSEEHNAANVLSLGARFLSAEDAKRAVDLWLTSAFSGEERHARRNSALDTL